MERTVQPELLDALAPDHPDAVRNRRDLRLTNAVMGNRRWFRRTLAALLRPSECVLELGAGTGELAHRLNRDGIATDGLDFWPPPPAWPAERRWLRTDLRQFSGYSPYAAVIGNLIFHQFTTAELAELGQRLDCAARVVVASEPARLRRSQILYRIFGPLCGANHVSLHDAHVSIAAGFLGAELPDLLGLNRRRWDIHCSCAPIGAYRMIAIRRDATASH